MEIYVVQPGDTIHSIADAYNIEPDILILNNGIINFNSLVVGQTIVIVYPKEVYTVVSGDTLYGIAEASGTSPLILLRNNPQLSDRRYLYPGEQLVIRYDNNKGRLKTNGYAYPFIDFNILRKTLPYLSFLTVLGNTLSPQGLLASNDDASIVNTARTYGVAPIMLLYAVDIADSNNIQPYFSSPNSYETNDFVISTILDKLIVTGYVGVNIYVQQITPENISILAENLRALTGRLKGYGLTVMLTLTPEVFNLPPGTTYLNINYTELSQAVDYILLQSYNWGLSFGPPAAVTPVNIVRRNLDYATTQIPSEKLLLGIPIIGYDWRLSEDNGYTVANALNSDAAILLAADVGAVIQFDYEAMAPFFTYTSRDNNTDVNHIVWFKDARSIDVLFALTQEYSLSGSAIWNIMHFFQQMWFIVNTQYEIVGPYDKLT